MMRKIRQVQLLSFLLLSSLQLDELEELDLELEDELELELEDQLEGSLLLLDGGWKP